MGQPRENHLWFVAIVSAALGFIGGMAWVGFGHEARWLYDYQTLIAGIAAVAAAYLTVNTMNKTDQQQQARHEELMRLNLRADRLRARRAAFPYALQMASVANTLTDYDVGDFENTATTDTGAVAIVAQCFRHIVKLMSEQSVVEAKDMFGSDMAHTLKFLRERIDSADKNYASAGNYARLGKAGGADIFKVRNFCRQVVLIAKPLGQFSEQLLTLAGHYGPD